jgi:hypothetical protein
MSQQDVVNVYWAPAFVPNVNDPFAWDMLYPDPKNLFTDLSKYKNIETSKVSYFVCPAFQGLSKNTYFFKNSVNAKYKYDFNTTLPSIKPITKNFVNVDIIRDPAISSYPLVAMSLFYIFFSDEPLIANFSPPTFHKPEYTKYGTCIPGEFDIGKWFRPFPMEIQLWEKDGTIEFKDGEPLFYVKFNTNKQINLKRFVFTEQLSKYSNHCTTYGNTFGNYHKFNQLYSKFNQSRMKELILKEIKNNLVEEIK